MKQFWSTRAIAAAIVAILAMVGACSSKDGDDADRQPEGSPPSSPDDDQGLGSLDMLRSMLANQLDAPGPYDEPRESDGFDPSAPHFAVLELSGPVVELQAFSWFSGMGGLELRTLTETLRGLAADPSVRGLLVRAGEIEMSVATAEELRDALGTFKDGGKRELHCHTEGVSNFTYYVLSVCDSIGLAPNGSIVISGVTAIPVHIKGLLEKLGMRPDFMHVGAYKGAAEPLTRTSPSPEMRTTLDAILDRAYDTLIAGIAEGRNLEPDAVKSLIDTALFHDQEVVDARLADAVEVYEAYRDARLDDAGWRVVKADSSGQPDMQTMMRFLGVMPRLRPTDPHVALVYAVGPVIDGKGSGTIGARGEIASRTLAAAIRTLAADSSVKAIALRIDSGGGSALASELIARAVAEARASKPVVVSMAGVAASGGYYIACSASQIFALDNTLTGSIGVVGGKLAMRGTLDDIGVGVFPMTRGKRALISAPFDLWTEDERTALKDYMEGVYETFIARVAAGRKKAPEDVQAIAQGRVWTGTQAKENGLVDRVGGLSEALAEARKLGGVADDVELEIYPPDITLIDVVNSLGQVSAPRGLALEIADIAHQLGQTTGHVEASVIAALVRQVLLLRDSPVLTATFFTPIVR